MENYDCIVATYFIESGLEPDRALDEIAKEQSMGIRNLHLPQANKDMYAAQPLVETISIIAARERPTLACQSAFSYQRYYQFTGKIAYPALSGCNMITTIWNTVIGEIFNMASLTAVKVLDIDFPADSYQVFKGPAYGVDRVREMIREQNTPIFIAPIKPSIGLNAQEFAKHAYEALMGGFHAVKDDELLVDPYYCRMGDRIRATITKVKEAEMKTGRKKFYFANISSDVNRIDELFSLAYSNGVDGIMVSPAINGIDVIAKFRGVLPIIAHNSSSYSFIRHPSFGISFSLFSKVQRMIGADFIIMPSKYGCFDVMNKQDQLDNIRACLSDSVNIPRCFPSFSGGQTPSTLKKHFVDVGCADFAIVAGSSVFEHPHGIFKGAEAFLNEWNINMQIGSSN